MFGSVRQCVEKIAGGYVERDRSGSKHKYVKLSGSRYLTIESLGVRWKIEPSGAKRCVIYGSTREKIRAIGVTGEYPIYSVEIVAGDRPGNATLVESYLVVAGDRLEHATLLESELLDVLENALSINISEVAIAALVEEIREAKTKRVITAQVKEGVFYGSSAEAAGGVLLLPWLEDQRKVDTTSLVELAVEFDLEVIDLTVGPEVSIFGESEAKVQADILPTRTSAEGNV